MTRSNRTLNRLLLAVIGLAALAAAAVMATATLAPDALGLRLDDVARWLSDPARAVIVGAAALLVVVLAVIWISTRGRGGTSIVDSHADVEITVGAARDIIDGELRAVPAVLSTRVDAHRLRRRTVLTVTLSTRRRADLLQVLDRARAAVSGLDDALGTRVPVVVRIRSGWRSALARDQRAE